MTPFIVACLHTIVLSIECEIAIYLVRLRRELMKVVAK